MFSRPCLLLAIVSVCWLPFLEGSSSPSEADGSLAADALKIMERNCLACHGVARQGGLDLSQRQTLLEGGHRGPAAVPGDAGSSLLFLAASHDGELKMPPGGSPLAAADLEVLRRWIDSGLGWAGDRKDGASPPSWWSFRKLAAATRSRDCSGRPGPESHRRLRAGPAAGKGLETGSRGRPADFGPKSLLRSHRTSADTGADGPAPGRRLARGLRQDGGRVAGVAPLRRALGPALAGRGPLCRQQRIRVGPLLPQRLALSGLRHQVVQRGQALRPLPAGADRRGRTLAPTIRTSGEPDHSPEEERIPGSTGRNRPLHVRARGAGIDAGRPAVARRGTDRLGGHHRRRLPGPHPGLRPLSRPQSGPHQPEGLLRLPSAVCQQPQGRHPRHESHSGGLAEHRLPRRHRRGRKPFRLPPIRETGGGRRGSKRRRKRNFHRRWWKPTRRTRTVGPRSRKNWPSP